VPYFFRKSSIENLRYNLECKDDFLNFEVKEGELAVAIDENGRIAAAGNYTEVRVVCSHKKSSTISKVEKIMYK
jgi:hypothetical protein